MFNSFIIFILFLLTVFITYSFFSYSFLNEVIWKIFNFVVQIKKKFQQVFELSVVINGKLLILFLQNVINQNQQLLKSNPQIPSYKYFSEILDELISFQKKYGVNIQKQLLSLRSSLALDLQFEQDLFVTVKAHILQLLLGDFAILSLSFGAQRILGFSSIILNFFLVLWQVFGIFLALYVSKKVMKGNTRGLFLSFKFLSKMEIYSGVLISSTTLSKNLNQADLLFLKNLPDYAFLANGLEQQLTQWIKTGINPAPSLGLYYSEWEFRQKQALLKIKNQLSLLSFALLILFNLLPYLFLVLFLLFSKFNS